MTNQRPFRFGVVADGAASSDEWIAKARKAEELCYSTFLVADHFVNDFDPIVALTAVATSTSTLRVGSFVFDNDFRHPAVTAKSAATLDLLSDGRFELGIGAGWLPEEYAQTGIPFDPAGVRIDRLEEALSIIKGLFTDEPVTFAVKHYTITSLQGLPKPVQQPHPPIFIGGGGKRVLSLAAREADIIGIHVKVNPDGRADLAERKPATLAQKVEWIRQAAGERFERLELNLLVSLVIVTADRQQAAEEYILNNEVKPGFTVEHMLETPYILIGSVDQITENIQTLRERYGVSYFSIFDEYIKTFAPVIARLAGK